ncbi:hypothetical protein M514_02339 [Trichuris suis]|uniref:Uncharacterized protein n=1 Tax=Trichuris suis TaxID=68888 RepID=A0A085NBJ9_9BILA|nr:hypothetical protein M513_02339 [Trichuris suis]KFD66845.1 hypothetical protein M514_02339 [Trichuris suis]
MQFFRSQQGGSATARSRYSNQELRTPLLRLCGPVLRRAKMDRDFARRYTNGCAISCLNGMECSLGAPTLDMEEFLWQWQRVDENLRRAKSEDALHGDRLERSQECDPLAVAP